MKRFLLLLALLACGNPYENNPPWQTVNILDCTLDDRKREVRCVVRYCEGRQVGGEWEFRNCVDAPLP